LALVFFYLLGKRLVGARRGFQAVLILIVLPYPAAYGSNVLREWPFLLFLGLGFWLLVRTWQDRQWWLLGLVGLSAGLGYLIRPMCGQLVIYGVLALLVALRVEGARAAPRLLGAGLLLLAGFALPVVPTLAWTGKVVPHQLSTPAGNSAPVIVSVGGKSASHEPLQFSVTAGELLELPIEAYDRDGPALVFSVVTVPSGARPVHRLRSAANDAAFWTISGAEKDALLDTYGSGVWDYDGIAYYAYARADAATGLEPVVRFWSPVLNRHVYVLGETRPGDVLDPSGAWQAEGIVFYAFPEGRQPAGAVAVYRHRDEAGRHSWSTQDGPGADGVAWYAHDGAEPPAGSTLQGGTFRWRPESSQSGGYLLNIIVDDGNLPSCQLVRIGVARGPLPADQSAGVFRVPAVIADVVKGMSDVLMVFFLLPLCLGFFHRLRQEAGCYERAVMVAVVVVNVGLISVRNLWVQPGPARRYCLGLIALTVLYIPGGLALMADWLRERQVSVRDWPWYPILLIGGIIACIPRLLTPIGSDKTGYLAAAQWLRANTEAHRTVAVPDRRISFYAERKGLIYKRGADPRKADFIVTISGKNVAGLGPKDWDQAYSLSVGEKGRKVLTIYRSPRAGTKGP